METTTELTREVRAKRVAVMRDVLKQLDRKEMPLVVAQGYGYLGGYADGELLEGSLQPHVDQLQKTCKVCMLGAAFLSFTRLYNGVPSAVVNDYGHSHGNFITISSDPMRSALSDVFDEFTLDLMESAFERCDMSGLTEGDRLDACIKAGQYGLQFGSPEAAARAIAQNIVANDGEFILPTPA